MLPRYNLDPAQWHYWYDADKVPALKMRQNEELVLRRGVNIETTDELREAVGLGEYEPTDAPGGTIMVQGTLVALGDDIFGDAEDDLPGFPGQPTPPEAPAEQEPEEDEV